MAGFFKSGQRVARAIAALAGFALALSGLARASDLLDVRFGPKADETRIVFDLMGAPDYRVSGDETGAGRLFVDFTSLEGALGARGGKGHIADVSFAKTADGGVRAVLDFKKTAKIKELFVLDPSGAVTKHRLVIDVVTADKSAFLASLPTPSDGIADIIAQMAGAQMAGDEEPANQTSTQNASLAEPPVPSRKEAAPAADEPKIVVIDPGHGGRDPGAIGQSGTLEKNVTLAAAKALAEMLEARGGYKIVMTRNEDETIRPDARETLARAAGADLFISLHADAIGQSQLRGGSVYTLAEKGTARTAKLAKSQGDYHVFDVALHEYDEAIAGILLDKAQDTTMTQSSKFAELLVHNLSGKTPLLNRSHRKGDLRVLLAADVPAVLFEMAFISNAEDEANLKSPVWRKRAMGAVADSIDAYFEGVTLQRHAQLSPVAGQ